MRNDIEKMLTTARETVVTAENAVQEARERLEDALIEGTAPEPHEAALTAAETRLEAARVRLAVVESAKVKADRREADAKEAATVQALQSRAEDGISRMRKAEAKIIKALAALGPVVIERDEALVTASGAERELRHRNVKDRPSVQPAESDDIQKDTGAGHFSWDVTPHSAGFVVRWPRV